MPAFHSRPLPAAVLGLALAANAVAQAPPVSFTLLGSLNGPNGFAIATGISDDGTTVVGSSSPPASRAHAFRWTAATGMVDLGVAAPNDSSGATGVSGDGSVVAGTASSSFSLTTEAFHVTPAGGIQGLGRLVGDTHSDAYGIDASGDVVVGSSSSNVTPQSAVFWFRGVIQALPKLDPNDGTYATCVADTGGVMAGVIWSPGPRAVRWDGGGIALLSPLPNMSPPHTQSDAIAISSLGDVIVGGSWSPAGSNPYARADYRPVRWRNGVARELGVVWGRGQAQVLCANADCTLIGGTSWVNGLGYRAELWTEQRGWIELHQLLALLNVNLGGETLTEIRGISADGTAIVGHTATGRAFLLRNLPLDGFAVRPTGCGSGRIDHWGRPVPGMTFGVNLTVSGFAFFAAGGATNTPLPQCPGCTVGASGTSFAGSSVSLAVPNAASLIGTTFSFQGCGLGGWTSACLGVANLTDTVDVTIRP
jgi:probable HAF family extracellular repeat protein